MEFNESQIVYRNYGLADRFPDGTIELNKHLNDYPELKKSILMHEARHTDNPKMNRKDLMNDLTSLNQYSMFALVKFMARHPLSIIQLLPIYKTKTAGWVYDEVATLYWAILVGVVGISFVVASAL